VTYPQQGAGQPPQGMPPQGPPPGYAPGQPTQYLPPQRPAAPKGATAVWALGLLSVILVVLGISLDENGQNAWHTVHAWGGLAIAGAVLTLAPVAGRSLGLTAQRAFQVAVVGAAALVLYWVLFVLPSVGSNTSLLTTLGVAAGVVAVWLAPGRDAAPNSAQGW
jgi:hypothetical protein